MAGVRIWVAVLHLFDLSVRLFMDIGVFALLRLSLWAVHWIERAVPVNDLVAGMIVTFHGCVAGITYAVLAIFAWVDIIRWRRGQ